MRTLFASFLTTEDAERAYAALTDHGLSSSHVSILTKQGGDIAPVTSAEDAENRADSGITTTTVQDAVAGAKPGAAIGLGVGALAALSALMIPGVGLVLGGGALAVALAGTAGATAAGAVAGGVYGYLRDMGMTEEQAESLGNAYESGRILVVADIPEDRDSMFVSEAEAIIEKYNGQLVRSEPNTMTSAHLL
jgi:hypothetical protein